MTWAGAKRHGPSVLNQAGRRWCWVDAIRRGGSVDRLVSKGGPIDDAPSTNPINQPRHMEHVALLASAGAGQRIAPVVSFDVEVQQIDTGLQFVGKIRHVGVKRFSRFTAAIEHSDPEIRRHVG